MSSTPSSEIDTQPSEKNGPSKSTTPHRRRTIMACTSCRTRKIRCLTSEQPPTNPCAYCKRKGFHCESASSPEPTSWKPPITSASFSAKPPSPALSLPGNHRSVSPPDSPFPPLPPRRKRARHWPTAQPTHSPASSQHPGRPHMAAPPDQLYDLQTLHALEYLSSRTNHSQPSIQPASQSAEHFNFAEDMQIPDLDLDFTATDMYAWALEVDAFHFGDDLAQSDGSETTPVPTSHESSTWRGSPSEG
ncbi:hypothetical protein B0H14DRAFT_3149196 [Mycena olivaceomarginata]|nr:hypothetical protein B0H14DRAFT_3149196 [Mycena olivaceomarginata]